MASPAINPPHQQQQLQPYLNGSSPHFSHQALHNPFNQKLPFTQQLPQNIPWTRERLQALLQRANILRANGLTPETSPELEKISRFITAVNNQYHKGQTRATQGEHPPTIDGNVAPAGTSLVNGHAPTVNGIQPSTSTSSVDSSATASTNGATTNNANGLLSTVQSSGQSINNNIQPPSPQPPVQFTNSQINALRIQIHAFKLISRGLPVPEVIQNALRPSALVEAGGSAVDLEKLLSAQNGLSGPDVQSKIADATKIIQKAISEQPSIPTTISGDAATPSAGSPEKEKTPGVKPEPTDVAIDAEPLPVGPFLEDDTTSGIHPYNAYTHPFTHLKRPANMDEKLWASRLQRLLVPSVMPQGLDPHQIIAERNRYIEARIEQRIRELSALPVTIADAGGFEGMMGRIGDVLMGDKENSAPGGESQKASTSSFDIAPTAHGKLRALIELKALRVRDKQRALRAQIVERLQHGTLLPLDRKDFRRTRRPTFRDARSTELAERKQRVDREQRAKQKHLEQLAGICQHGRDMIASNRTAQDRVLKTGKAVLAFHVHTEKEEAKRIEKISKERLKALKADDEEAYMRLIDTAKDTRITHLLKQTDSYLDSLAQAVVAQQHENFDLGSSMEDGPMDESMFGAQVMEDEEEKTKIDYYAVAHRIKERVTKQPNILVGGTLKDYQLKGLQWMVSLYNNRLNGILADEMGLGKTIQTISLITFLIEVKQQRGPFLVIVPLSTMTNWSGEFAKWAPSVKTIAYKGNPLQRRALATDVRVGQFQVLLTTYEYIIKDRPVLSKMKWLHMIIDEGHRMKNTQSKLAQTLTQYYHCRYRLILTGTPLQNNLPELWALLNFALPKVFNSVKSFDEWFNTPFANSGSTDKIELNEEETLLVIRRLHKVLRPFLLRRLKKDVESELPDKVEKIVKVKMSALQVQLYKQMKKYKMIADGRELKGKQGGGVKGLSNELMQLRKICQHPYLFESVEDKISPHGLIDDNIYRVAGKFELLTRILPKFFATGHRILIFFQMTKVMDIMEDFLKMQGWKHLRLDGGTKTEERASHVQVFNAVDSEIQVFILSTRAGGLGLNLQTADTVIIFDSDWNPHADLQAQDRAHRIGQTKAVRILRFITEKSVEEAMYARARYKLDIDDKVIQAGRFDNKSTQEEQEEFLRSILEADQEEESEEAGDMNDEEINMIIARDDNELEVFRDMDIQRLRRQKDSWELSGGHGPPPSSLIQLEELPECYRSDDYFDAKDMEEELEGRGHRRRTIVSYNDGLSDDAWAQALEEEGDVQDLIERNREKSQRRAANKLLRESEHSSRNSPAGEDVKGRKGKKGKKIIAEPEFEPASASGKRKRGGKAVSVTPSVNDDDEDSRDQKRRKIKQADLVPGIREKMKKVFNECFRVVAACEEPGTGRRRSELFKELPDKREYPDYYHTISQPISMAQLKKRAQTGHYRDVQQYKEDWLLMFRNARTYNQEGSWVYVDAEEMEKVFLKVFDRETRGSGLPGAGPSSSSNTTSDSSPAEYDSLSKPLARRSTSRHNSKQVLSDDDEYLTTPTDDD